MLSLVVCNLAQLVLLDNNLSCFQGLKYFNVSFWLMIKVIFIIMPLGTNLRLGELSESQVWRPWCTFVMGPSSSQIKSWNSGFWSKWVLGFRSIKKLKLDWSKHSFIISYEVSSWFYPFKVACCSHNLRRFSLRNKQNHFCQLHS